MSEERKNELAKIIADVECYPVELQQDALKVYEQVSFDGIASLGSVFAQFPKSFRSITTQVQGGQPLYQLNMNGLNGKLLSLGGDGQNMLSAVHNGEHIIGHASYTQVNPNMVTTVPVNPAMICMSVALMGIEKKLDVIQETQQKILSFLEQKNESELIGNVKFLEDVLKNYKFNWDNERYKDNMHVKALDIKQISEQNIVFYRKKIDELIGKKSLVHSGQQTTKQISDAQNNFKYYKLAIYLYAFSSFLEALLLENFDHAYLESIRDKINSYSLEYREFYTECYNRLEHNAKTSVESFIVKGLSKASKTTGETISKVPGINKVQIDGSLKNGSAKLEEFGNKQTEKTMDGFRDNDANEATIFADNILAIDGVYNRCDGLLFDENNLYLKIESV